MQRREIEDETPFRHAYAEIRTRVVVICDRPRYQLDHGGALILGHGPWRFATPLK